MVKLSIKIDYDFFKWCFIETLYRIELNYEDTLFHKNVFKLSEFWDLNDNVDSNTMVSVDIATQLEIGEKYGISISRPVDAIICLSNDLDKIYHLTLDEKREFCIEVLEHWDHIVDITNRSFVTEYRRLCYNIDFWYGRTEQLSLFPKLIERKKTVQ